MNKKSLDEKFENREEIRADIKYMQKRVADGVASDVVVMIHRRLKHIEQILDAQLWEGIDDG